MLQPQTLREALTTLGELLRERGLHFGVVVVGGSGLVLLGLVSRSTQDVDVIGLMNGASIVAAHGLPRGLADAVADTARLLSLPRDWLNTRPSRLVDLGLPSGFEDRLVRLDFGALSVYLASRTDQIAFKLHAVVDQGPDTRHMQDLRALEPTREESIAAAKWVLVQAPAPQHRRILVDALTNLGLTDAQYEL